MKIRYIFPLSRPMIIEDHWPVPLLGGLCRLKEHEGKVVAIEFSKGGLSTALSYSIDETPGEKTVMSITSRDTLLPEVRERINRAFSYLQCFFDTAVSTTEVETFYEPETDSEKEEIKLSSIHIGRRKNEPLDITYDFFTRALSASEMREGPEFVASLAATARQYLTERRFIDSFRYSFLLIDSLYSKGNFKSKQLTQALLSSSQFVKAVGYAIRELRDIGSTSLSPTYKLLHSKPTMENIVDHLVAQRGRYFHGNIDRANFWHQRKQDEAESLAWFCIDIVSQIATDAALPMFTDEMAKRHFDDAGKVGTHVVMEIFYQYRLPNEEILHVTSVDFRMPGTKPTTFMAMEGAKRAIENFQERLPVARLRSVWAVNAADGKELFRLTFATEPDGLVVKS